MLLKKINILWKNSMHIDFFNSILIFFGIYVCERFADIFIKNIVKGLGKSQVGLVFFEAES